MGLDHITVHAIQNYWAADFYEEGKLEKALPLVQTLIARKGEFRAWPVLPVLFAARGKKLISSESAMDDSLTAVQRIEQSAAGKALNQLAVNRRWIGTPDRHPKGTPSFSVSND